MVCSERERETESDQIGAHSFCRQGLNSPWPLLLKGCQQLVFFLLTAEATNSHICTFKSQEITSHNSTRHLFVWLYAPESPVHLLSIFTLKKKIALFVM